MRLSLHINSNHSIFLNIGNTTVFNSSSAGEQTITKENAELSTLLNYNFLSEKTIPLRLGISVYSGAAGNVDVFSAADISGSMGGQKIADAKNASKTLIDIILNYSGNRVGLTGYDTWAEKINYHQLSTNKNSLN